MESLEITSLRIQLLSEMIKRNRATVKDYKEYERILKVNGYSKKKIRKPLKAAGLNSYGELIFARKNASSFEERRRFEVVLLSVLLAYGLAVLLNGLLCLE